MLKHFLPVFVWNILSRRLASSPLRIFEVPLEFTKKGVSKHCCDLSIRARQDNYYTVLWLDSAQNSNTIPQNLDFEERLALFNVISERYRTRLIHTIFDIFWEWCKNIVDPKYISFKTAPGITIWQSHGEIQVWSVISVTVISVTFPTISYVIYMGKKLFPIISTPNIFTRSRDVKQWNKTFKNEKN